MLYRGTRDGFSGDKFHEMCDDQSHTVTIVKVKNSNEILGGYNPIVWQKSIFSSYSNTKKSFIFSFRDKENIESYILSRVKRNAFAIVLNSALGSFGRGDLSLSQLHCRCQKNSYEKAIRETGAKFTMKEYEVFQMKI